METIPIACKCCFPKFICTHISKSNNFKKTKTKKFKKRVVVKAPFEDGPKLLNPKCGFRKWNVK